MTVQWWLAHGTTGTHLLMSQGGVSESHQPQVTLQNYITQQAPGHCTPGSREEGLEPRTPGSGVSGHWGPGLAGPDPQPPPQERLDHAAERLLSRPPPGYYLSFLTIPLCLAAEGRLESALWGRLSPGGQKAWDWVHWFLKMRAYDYMCMGRALATARC
ncbi:lysophospholipid acyltransferase 7 [Papio anubis]|uniref:lysophospholipid acyltransferase 7 n=1 Tax=Papio anubis TaxID=9555 RepID=UPI0012ADB659|nr:lysophospholipid acyltransferase 7 [Papio anubis]